MLSFLKKVFCAAEPDAPAPYKVETPVAAAEKPAKPVKPKAEKKPAVKKATTRKPRTPKA
jgi:hypothetical protein